MSETRGYWLPDGCKELQAYDGFYIPARVVYKTADIDAGWAAFEKTVIIELTEKDKTLRRFCDMRSCIKKMRYVLVRNSEVDIIAEQCDGPKGHSDEEYIAVFAIIPEDCDSPLKALRFFNHYVSILRDVLCKLYPGDVYERVNSQKIKPIDKNKKRRRRRRETSSY